MSLKNDVLTLDEREAAGEPLAEGWFHLLRFIKRIGLRIIAFPAQIEGFQKMLWEKQQIVTEVVSPVTVGDIPEMWYAEIAVCAAYWKKWKVLVAIDALNDAAQRLAVLNAHPTLVLDTRHVLPVGLHRPPAGFV